MLANAKSQIEKLERELDETYRSVTELTNDLAQAKERFERKSLTDHLTDLPNRALFLDRLNQAISFALRENRNFAVLLIDLNRFKEVNDTLGHEVGDSLLRQVAIKLHSSIRQSDTIARLGGDEFAVILPTAVDVDESVLVAKKLIQAVETPILIDDHRVEVGASVGIAIFPRHGTDGASLLRHADEAMYDAKRARSGFVLFENRTDGSKFNNALLVADLRQAIEHDQLALHYQPKVNLRTGDIVGVEALTRWHHPMHGYLPPRDFFPAAERTAVIKPLTLAVIRKSLGQLQDWRRANLNCTMSVNLSSRILHDWQLPHDVLDLVKLWPTPPAGLIFEITESAFMTEPRRVIEIAQRLNSTGVSICIDNFGSGCTCLSLLKDMPIQEIKIDMSFIQNLENDNSDRAIVQSIINLCDGLGIDVVAEGVETQAVWDLLRELGCHMAQGFYVSPAMPGDAFPRWHDEWAGRKIERLEYQVFRSETRI